MPRMQKHRYIYLAFGFMALCLTHLVAARYTHLEHFIDCLIPEKNHAPSPEPSITWPGPDMSNVTTSPFTLPKGRGYFENAPLYFGVGNKHMSMSYNWPFLVRIGLTDFLEFRVLGNGLTKSCTGVCPRSTVGFSPLLFGLKAYVFGDPEVLGEPNLGVEFDVVTPIASDALKGDTQFIVSLLADQKLSESVNLEWNVSMYTRSLKPIKRRGCCALLEGVLQKSVCEKLILFAQAAYGSAPRILYHGGLFIGLGFQSNVTKRLCLYGSYNWAVIGKTSQDIANLGFTVAF